MSYLAIQVCQCQIIITFVVKAMTNPVLREILLNCCSLCNRVGVPVNYSGFINYSIFREIMP